MASRTLTLTTPDSDRQHSVEVVHADGKQVARIDGREFSIETDGRGGLRISPSDGANAVSAWTIVAGDVRWVFVDGRVYQLTEARPHARSRSAHQGSLSAPMPATVRRVLVKPGDAVKRGDTLLILEAMKMELPVRASAAGTVRAVHCREGELVQPAIPLIEVGE